MSFIGINFSFYISQAFLWIILIKPMGSLYLELNKQICRRTINYFEGLTKPNIERFRSKYEKKIEQFLFGDLNTNPGYLLRSESMTTASSPDDIIALTNLDSSQQKSKKTSIREVQKRKESQDDSKPSKKTCTSKSQKQDAIIEDDSDEGDTTERDSNKPSQTCISQSVARPSNHLTKSVTDDMNDGHLRVQDEPVGDYEELSFIGTKRLLDLLPIADDYITKIQQVYAQFKGKEALVSQYLATQTFTEDVIYLPNIFYTDAFQEERFDQFHCRNKQFIVMVNRSHLVKRYLDELERSNVIVYGPQGCGKSFVVYQLVAQLIKQQKYFVVYVNEASCLLIDHVLSIVAAKIGKEATDDLVSRLKKRCLGSLSLDVGNVIRFIVCAQEAIKRPILFVIDQINNVNDEKSINFIIALRSENYRLVIAGNADYDPTIFKMEDVRNRPVVPDLVEFSKKEFRALCRIIKPRKKEFTPEQTERIYLISGGVALLLHDFLAKYVRDDQDFSTSIYQFKGYVLGAFLAGVTILSYLSKPGVRVEDAVKNVYNLLNNRPTRGNDTYDRRYIYRVEKGDHMYLKAVSLQALKSIVKFYLNKTSSTNTLDDWFCQPVQENLKDEPGGLLAEKYVIASLQRRADQATTFPVHCLHRNPAAVTQTVLTIEKFKFVYLKGRRAPLKRTYWDQNIVFVPELSNYPGYDLFYYEHRSKRLFMIRITVQHAPLCHVESNYKSPSVDAVIESWRRFLPEDTDIVELWMVKKTSGISTSSSDLKNYLNVIYFAEIDLNLLKLVETFKR